MSFTYTGELYCSFTRTPGKSRDLWFIINLKKKTKKTWQIHFFNKQTVNEQQGIGSLKHKDSMKQLKQLSNWVIFDTIVIHCVEFFALKTKKSFMILRFLFSFTVTRLASVLDFLTAIFGLGRCETPIFKAKN